MSFTIGLPYNYEQGSGDAPCGQYLCVCGGSYSEDSGCPSWGTSDPRNVRFIGDNFGDLVIRYSDGSEDNVPLVLGYTLWLHSIWTERPAPFFGEGTDPELVRLLKETLCIKGAYELEDPWVTRIVLKRRPVKEIYIKPNPDKAGTPLFTGAFITDALQSGIDGSETSFKAGEKHIDVNDPFFAAHTVVPGEVPAACQNALNAICFALHTFEPDFEAAPEQFEYPASPADSGPEILFSGSRLAAIGTGVVYTNMDNLIERTDDDGFVHTSYQDAPTWRYDGFGPYVLRANSYTDAFYSRDAARAIMTLNSYGHREKANSGCGFGNRWMMYYPEHGLTIKGVPIPGHFSVIPNKPLIYSTVLTGVGWPTRYTEEEFGEGYRNLGNQETDGHGLMMMANYLVWRNLGCPDTWVRDNWKYINEAASWLMWCFEYPELSFVKDGLLYGETEAAMNDWTLYANVPCCLGLSGYSEMADLAGYKEEAEAWREAALRHAEAISKHLSKGSGWDMEHKGFIHDPVVTMLSDIYGFDTDDMPRSWVARSQESYDGDIAQPREFGYFGHGGGMGYDHSMITQSALLLDRMYDGSRLMESLCKMCYAPRLPGTYMVPEGMSVDAKVGVLRRQGDLGNLVQLAEAMKCFLIVTGISPLTSGTLKVMPRLPEGWSVRADNFRIQNTEVEASFSATYPEGGRQKVNLSLKKPRDGAPVPFKKVRVRFGPFPMSLEKAEVTLNGNTFTLPLFASGDSKWAWAETDAVLKDE